MITNQEIYEMGNPMAFEHSPKSCSIEDGTASQIEILLGCSVT